MDDVANANQDFISQYSAGKTVQNRDLRVLVLKVGNPSKNIWIDCGIHAREWISPATCVNLIDKVFKFFNFSKYFNIQLNIFQFVNDYKSNVSAVVNILNKYEIHFLPVLNPGKRNCNKNKLLKKKNFVF
jgi:hypothetical protein